MAKKLLMVDKLSIKDINRQEGHYILKDISFELEKGQVLALMGETGSGKTLTAKAIMGVLAENLRPSGRIIFKDNNILAYTESQMEVLRGKQIGMAFQNPESSLNQLLNNKRQMELIVGKEREKQLGRLEMVGLKDLDILKMYPFELSGGMAQRFMMALGLGQGVDLVIFDEPTRGLDKKSKEVFIELLQTLVNDFEISIILSSHDMDLVEKVAHSCLILKKGRVGSYSSLEDLFESESKYISKLISSDPRKYRIIPKRQVGESAQTILEIKNLKTSYSKGLFKSDRHQVLKDINLKTYYKEVVGILGESGCGKTTLASCILGLKDYKGEIKYRGQVLKKKIGKRPISIIGQSATSAFNPVRTIRDSLQEIFAIQAEKRQDKMEVQILSMIKELGLENIYDRLDDYPAQFSGGQLQRLAILRAVLAKSELLILDELSSMLDLFTQAKVIRLLERIREERNLSYIFISHDIDLMEQFADRIFYMEDGSLSPYQRQKL